MDDSPFSTPVSRHLSRPASLPRSDGGMGRPIRNVRQWAEYTVWHMTLTPSGGVVVAQDAILHYVIPYRSQWVEYWHTVTA